MDWIQQFLHQTNDYEAPVHYYFWSGLAAISAAVKDHVWIERGSEIDKTYPNIYVLLLAKTGITRKSHSISLIEKIVVAAKITRVISGRNSIEKIADDLGTGTADLQTKTIIKDAAGLLTFSELTANLINSPQALTMLTDLFDRHYRTDQPYLINLKSGVKKLHNPIITMLAATNDQHMKDFFQAKDMYGGFLGRTIVVSADVPKRLNALLRRRQVTVNIKDLSEYLKCINKLTGPFYLSEEVIDYYEKWYEGFYGPVQRGEADVHDKTGTFSRIGDHVLRVTMLLSLAESPNLQIEVKHLKEAISLCEPFVEISARAVRGIGKNTLAQQTANVMEYLEQREGRATRVSILQRFVGDVDTTDLNNIETTLEESGFINIEQFKNGKVYQIPPEVLEKYRKFKLSKKGGDKS